MIKSKEFSQIVQAAERRLAAEQEQKTQKEVLISMELLLIDSS